MKTAKLQAAWQKLRAFEFHRKKTVGRMQVTTAEATGRPVMKHRYTGTAGLTQGSATTRPP